MTDAVWRVSKHGLTISLRVTPKASRNSITGIYKNSDENMSLKVSTTAQPEKGRANKAVIAILSKKFSKAKSTFKVISGETDRNKTILINGEIDDKKKWLLPKLREFENG